MNSTEFICPCGKAKGWLTEGVETKPCPCCGKVWVGVYDHKNLTIKPVLTNEVYEKTRGEE